MDRRGFLKGAFGGVAAGGIIIAASLPDTAEFMSQVGLGDPISASAASFGLPHDIGELVFNHKGEILGVIDHIEVGSHISDVSSYNDSHRTEVSWGRTVKFTVVSSGPVQAYRAHEVFLGK